MAMKTWLRLDERLKQRHDLSQVVVSTVPAEDLILGEEIDLVKTRHRL